MSVQRQKFWVFAKWGGAVAAVAALVAVGFLLWVTFFKTPDENLGAAAFPPDGAVVQESMATFRWPEGESAGWEFRLEDESGEVTYAERVKADQVTLPYGVLIPDREFRWEVYSTDEAGVVAELPTVSRSFRTSRAIKKKTRTGSLTVFPERVAVNRWNAVTHLALEVECTGDFTVSLPESLAFNDGTRRFEGSGIAVVYPVFNLSTVSGDPAEWGKISIEACDQEVLVPVTPDTSSLGRLVRAFDSGFDPYVDTPSFANFERGWLSRLTQGTCVGIALAVKLFYEHVEFGMSPGVEADTLSPVILLESMISRRPLVFRSSVNFRELSAKQTRLVTGLMSLLHLENLNPFNIKETVRAVLRDPQARVDSHLRAELEAGRLPVVAGFRLRRKLLKTRRRVHSFAMMDSGHAFVVFKGWLFENASLYAVYDPNYEYLQNMPGRNALVLAPGERAAYYSGGSIDLDLVRFMPLSSSQLYAFLAVTAEGLRQGLRDVVGAFGNIKTILELW